ncbi:hypothetical protein DEEACLCL_00073 [Salmonella phage CRW-SP2]|nr:hypothetical protein DEEACLCL_00073 [Salmonella phage CRW-SP2]
MSGQYKIFVTSTRDNSFNGVSVHTSTLDFESRETADVAYDKLVDSEQDVRNQIGVYQTFVKLY